MKLLRFSAIFLAFMLMAGLASCDTTRRASRRIRHILNEHPELLDHDTIRVDTIVTAVVPADTIVFSWEDFYVADSNACSLIPIDIITKKTGQGTFTIERLPNRKDYVVSYQPDTIQIRARATYTVPKITVAETRKTDISDVMKWLVIGTIVVLFARLLLKK